METTQAMGEGLTFEKVWAALMETRERQEATDRQMKETGRIVKENAQQMKETDKWVGELTNRFGEVVEHMIVPNLVAKFRELGFEFEQSNRGKVIKSVKHNISTEVDAFLENGDKVMAVETKTKVKTGDIDDHIERMEKLRRYADLHDDKRKYLGAIAGVVFGDVEKTYALKKGFYVIEPSGDTFNITEPTGSYHPHEW
ncbi:hypothetical protein FACS1894190_04550 [Spirochaetia bacterium]|nr:hypothetical protein FACS1894190_04550 [Spirochaetia bacterium]